MTTVNAGNISGSSLSSTGTLNVSGTTTLGALVLNGNLNHNSTSTFSSTVNIDTLDASSVTFNPVNNDSSYKAMKIYQNNNAARIEFGYSGDSSRVVFLSEQTTFNKSVLFEYHTTITGNDAKLILGTGGKIDGTVVTGIFTSDNKTRVKNGLVTCFGAMSSAERTAVRNALNAA